QGPAGARNAGAQAPVTPICPEDAPYRGSFVTEAGIETGICTSNPERGVLGPTAATGALVPDRLAGPMTLRGGELEPVGETVLREAYVQIGAYARPANAEGARARLAALGLPVAGAKARMAGKPVQIVFAGPFELAGEARAARAAARKAGFRDAFIR
ncbi:SPOR domain-containing protein, partial [Cereibacter changlensis]|uniref:SPOR domain-containing protein n=1 Tax=Cereibacter changlensis TaxID=402884 RepID=UPI001B80911D